MRKEKIKMVEKKVKAIALCRVSSVEQLKNNSLNTQDKKVREIAKDYNAEIVKVWSHQVSSKRGKNVERKDLQEMMEFCDKNKGIKYLFISEPDRFMRAADEAIWAEVEFRRRKVEIIFSDPMLNGGDMQSRLQRYLRYYAAEGSNEERIRKSIDGHAAALKEGRYTFQPPIGYKRGKTAGIHEIDPVIGPVLQQALIAIADGAKTIKQSMAWYNENCPPIRDGKHTKIRMDKWTKFIANPYYAGIVEMGKQIKVRNENGLHEPLITKEHHEKILEALRHRKKIHKGPIKGGNKRFPLNKILLCEECASRGNKVIKFTGYDNTNGKTTKKYSRYWCRGCNKSLSRDEVHEQVKMLFNRLDFTETGRKAVVRALNQVWNKEESGLKVQLGLYKQDLTKLQERKQTILEKAIEADNQLLKDELNKYLERTIDEITKLEIRIEIVEKNLSSGRGDFISFALEYIDNMGEHFFELPLEEVEVCKNILFPSGFWVDSNKTVYTLEISPLYRERTTKMGSFNPENCPMVGRKRLELLTSSV